MNRKAGAAILAAMLLVSCGLCAGPGPGSGDTSAHEERTVWFPDAVSCRVVMPEGCSGDVRYAAAGIAAALECAGGDGAVFTDSEPEREKEILVGNVRRA